MKTAKEWAESVVIGPEHLDHWMWAVRVCDDQGSVSLIEPSCSDDARDLANDARGIVERLVEQVQADARAPLEEEIARLRAENKALEDGVCKGAEAADMIRICLVMALRRPASLLDEVRQLVATLERARVP